MRPTHPPRLPPTAPPSHHSSHPTTSPLQGWGFISGPTKSGDGAVPLSLLSLLPLRALQRMHNTVLALETQLHTDVVSGPLLYISRTSPGVSQRGVAVYTMWQPLKEGRLEGVETGNSLSPSPPSTPLRCLPRGPSCSPRRSPPSCLFVRS